MDMNKFKHPYINVKSYKENSELQGDLVIKEAVETQVGGKIRPSLLFQNTNYAWTLNEVNRIKLVAKLGSDSDKWTGAKISLGIEKTEFEGNIVEGLRIKNIQ